MTDTGWLTSTIEHVTVHRAGALVRRRVPLPAGTAGTTATLAPLQIGPLPLSLENASVRVTIARPAGATGSLAATDVQVTVVVPPLGASIVAPAEAEIRDARREVDRLGTRHARVERELALLGTLRFTLAEPHPKRVPKPAPLAAWRELDAWARGRRRALVTERVELDRALVLARERVQDLEQRQARARAGQDASADTVTKVVRLTLRGDAPPAGTSLELAYIVPGATWTPTYVLRVARDGRTATLALRAHIAQASGEPWDRVAMALSTAKIRRETDLPELASLRIGRRQAKPPSNGWRSPPEGSGVLFGALDQALAGMPSPGDLARRPAALDALVDDARGLVAEVRPQPRAKRAIATSPEPVPPPSPAPAPPPVRAGGLPPGAAPNQPFAVLASMMQAPASAASAPQPKKDMARSRKRSERSADLPAEAEVARGGAPMEEADEAASMDSMDAEPEPKAAPPGRPARDLLQYGNLVMRQWNEPERGRVASRPAERVREVAAAHARAQAVSSLPLPTGTWSVAASIGEFDHVHVAEGPVDVPNDGRFHNVALAVRAAPIRSTMVIVPRESTDAVRVATLQNPLAVPLLTGPADVYWGDELLVTSLIRTTPPGGELRVGLGIDERMKVARNVHYEEETKGLLSSSAHLRHEVKIDIGSRLAEVVQVEVRERVPLRDEGEKEDLDLTITRVEPPWEEYDQTELAPAPLRGGKRWRFELGPGEDKQLVYSYVVKIGAKHELVGGNRRE